MQGGPRRGRSPITGPALPCAAQASQLRRRAKRRTRRAAKSKNSLPTGEITRRAGVPIACQAKNAVPEGQQNKRITLPTGEITRRTGVPIACQAKNSVPDGQQKSKKKIPAVEEKRAPRRRPNFAGGRNAVPAGPQNQRKSPTDSDFYARRAAK